MKSMLRTFLVATFAAGVLAACGGGSSNSNSTPTQITGVATPQAVSAVTAN